MIEVIFIIIELLIILCMGFGYCLRFTRVEGMPSIENGIIAPVKGFVQSQY
mgnify:CR=1 FL=1